MITKYSDAYNVLFEKATQRLAELNIVDADTGKAVKINSLEEYFSHLRDLIYGNNDLNEKQQKAGYLFLRLPLDEPEFKIDANTRKIEIPNHYLANGLSVQGDEVSEIVFFEIDRFFDATDLSAQSISIQWETPNGVQGHTEAFIRDIESKAEEDKLIFGWPITSAVTKVPGKLKFSVRFYTEDSQWAEEGQEKGFSYVFSTLPATIAINAGLTMDTMQVEADSAADLILGRLDNSPIGGIGDASTPVFVYWNPATNGLENIENIAATFDDQITTPVTLAALATKNDSGTLYYGWFHNNEQLNGDTHNDWKIALDAGSYLPVSEHIYGIATYFYKDENGAYQKIVVYPKDFDKTKETYGTLYANCSTYTLTSDNVKAGEYWVNAKNVYYGTKAFATEVGHENKKLLPKWEVKGPVSPEIIENLSTELLATANEDGSATFDKTLKIIANNTDENTVYEWTYTNSMGESTVLEGANTNEYNPYGGVTGFKEGDYVVSISNTKNNATVVVNSATCRALNPIDPISFEMSNVNGTWSPRFSRREYPYEKYTYAWYDYTNYQSPVFLSANREFTPTEIKPYKFICTITKGKNDNPLYTEVFEDLFQPSQI